MMAPMSGGATRRDLLFAAAGLLVCGPAWAVSESHDVSYGVGPNRADLEARRAVVARVLGPGVARQLAIVQLKEGRYALVYRRGGDLAGASTAARRHTQLLRRYGIEAAPIARQGHVIWPEHLAMAEGPVILGEGPAPGALAVPGPPAPAAMARAEATVPAVAAPSAGGGDEPLDAVIDAHVKALRRQGRVAADERTSWLVQELESDRVLAAILPEVPRQAASMIKPLVMLAFFHEVARGRFVYGPDSRGRLEAMIRHSSNVSTNWAIDLLGGPRAVHGILHEAYGGLVPHTTVVERIGPGGRTYRNLASVGDYGRYLRALWRDELPWSKEQRRILGLSNTDRIYHGAPSIPRGTMVYDKTGSTARCCGNMGIVVARRRGGGRLAYVFCGVIEKARRAPSYSRWISARSDVLRSVSDLVYRELKPLYDLA